MAVDHLYLFDHCTLSTLRSSWRKPMKLFQIKLPKPKRKKNKSLKCTEYEDFDHIPLSPGMLAEVFFNFRVLHFCLFILLFDILMKAQSHADLKEK